MSIKFDLTCDLLLAISVGEVLADIGSWGVCPIVENSAPYGTEIFGCNGP